MFTSSLHEMLQDILLPDYLIFLHTTAVFLCWFFRYLRYIIVWLSQCSVCVRYLTSVYLKKWHKVLWYCQHVQLRSTSPCQYSWVLWGKSQQCRCTRCWRPSWSQTFQSFLMPEQHCEGLRREEIERDLIVFWFNDIRALLCKKGNLTVRDELDEQKNSSSNDKEQWKEHSSGTCF